MQPEHGSPEAPPALPEELPLPALLERMLDDSRQLVRLELALAGEELREEGRSLRRGAVVALSGVMASIIGVAVLVSGVLLFFGAPAWVAPVTGAGLCAAGAVALVIGAHLVPKSLLTRTRRRLREDADQIKAHVS